MAELVISDNESVSDSSSEEEEIVAPLLVPEPKKKGGKAGRKNARKTPERVAEDIIKEQIVDTIPMRGRGKKTIAKKVAEEKGEPVPDPIKKSRKKVTIEEVETEELPPHMGGEPAPVKKAKRAVSPKTKERLVAQLAKGRATRAANFKKKQEERSAMLEKVKMKVAEPAAVKEIHHYHAPPPQEEKPKPKAAAKAVAKPRPQPIFI
jgi:hypothetical protein